MKELFEVAVAVQLYIALTELKLTERVEAVHGVRTAAAYYRCVVTSTEIVLALDPGNQKATLRRELAMERISQGMRVV